MSTSLPHRQMIMNGCVEYAKLSGSTRVESELLPQMWEQITHKYYERRLLVAESCGVLAPYIPVSHMHVYTRFGVWCRWLFVCLTLLASFFLPSHLSFKNMYMYTRWFNDSFCICIMYNV